MKRIMIGVFISALLFACNNEKKDDKAVTEPTTVSSAEKKPASELLDISEGDPLKKSFEAFSKGDVDGMVSIYSDSVFYSFSGGDSLIGKQAVKDYYNGRWKLIDSLKFSDQIVLPVQVNESQSKAAPPGKWILFWTATDVKYKNGKKLHFWLHNVNHYNDKGKIDFVGQYIDRAPLMAATKGIVVK